MAPDPQYVSILVALNAALLLILAGVAKNQLDWKRSERQPPAAVAYVAAAILVVFATR